MSEASETPKRSKRSLYSIHRGMLDVPLAIAISTLLLIAGLFMPIISIKQLIFKTDTFSVLTGIRSLWTEHQKILAAVVFLFSIVFPIVKLTCLTGIWFGRYTDDTRNKVLGWFDVLGKWSMLDVFIVAVTIVIAKISAVLDAHAQPGIYVFAASIALSILAGMRVESVSRRTLPPRSR
jgi:paraquat-inducible protein A